MTSRKGGKPVAFLALYAMLLAAALVLTASGARLYAALTESRAANQSLRGTAAYVQSRVQAADAAGGVSLGEGPEGDALLLREGDSGYETRIYLCDGALVEELAPAGSALDPAAAQRVCAAASFSVSLSGDGLLTITADGATALAALRSGGGGEP